jgi:hypothetical protein
VVLEFHLVLLRIFYILFFKKIKFKFENSSILEFRPGRLRRIQRICEPCWAVEPSKLGNRKGRGPFMFATGQRSTVHERKCLQMPSASGWGVQPVRGAQLRSSLFAGVLRRLNSAVRPRKIRGIGGLLKTALGSACNMKMCGTVILATAYDVTVHIYSQKVTTDYAQE